MLLALGVAACDAQPDAPRHESEPTVDGAHADHAVDADSSLAPGVPADMSVYNLESAWTDADGTPQTLGSLAGRVQVVGLVYTNCAFACPRVIADMKRIEAALPDVGFVLVSIDPERDTPERLRQFADGARLSDERWTLLTGSDDSLIELAAVLGVRYRRISESDFMHSNLLTVLDRNGEIVHRQLGLGQVDQTIEAIREITP